MITSSTPKVLDRVILKRVADLSRLPIAELGFVVNSVSVDRCLFFLSRFHLDRNRRSGGGCQRQVRRIWRSYRLNFFKLIIRFLKFDVLESHLELGAGE